MSWPLRIMSVLLEIGEVLFGAVPIVLGFVARREDDSTLVDPFSLAFGGFYCLLPSAAIVGIGLLIG